MRHIQVNRGPPLRNIHIAFNFDSSLSFLNLQICCTIALCTPLSNIWQGEMVGEKKMTEVLFVVLCFDVSCQASRLRQLVQEISKFREIIYDLGISTNQSRKLLLFLLYTSARQKVNFSVGQRSSTQCTIQLCGCVRFFVVAGNSSQNENTF